MIELSKELTERIKEVGKDPAWMEKFRAATTWEEYERLLGEKDIEAPQELKAAFHLNSTGKTGKLEDDELEKVSGGANLFECPREPSALLCGLTNCPHVHWGPMLALFDSEKVNYCDLGHWREVY